MLYKKKGVKKGVTLKNLQMSNLLKPLHKCGDHKCQIIIFDARVHFADLFLCMYCSTQNIAPSCQTSAYQLSDYFIGQIGHNLQLFVFKRKP